MTLLTAPNVQSDTTDADPIDLYRLGMFFIVQCFYWSCWASNDPEGLELTPDRIDVRVIALCGIKALLDTVRPSCCSASLNHGGATGRPADLAAPCRYCW